MSHRIFRLMSRLADVRSRFSAAVRKPLGSQSRLPTLTKNAPSHRTGIAIALAAMLLTSVACNRTSSDGTAEFAPVGRRTAGEATDFPVAVVAAAQPPKPSPMEKPAPMPVEEKPAKPKKSEEADAFFTSGPILELQLNIEPAEMQMLRQNARAYVRATLVERETGKKYSSVGVKLKGAAGSFRNVDDRPALTVNVNRFTKGQEFHGLEKFHLNNSVQDESYLHELVCAEIGRAAGVPTTRVTHARFWLNNRDLGLYVLKESFDRDFLRRHFKNGDGNLYDGGFLQDIDVDLEKDSGTGPDDRSDLKALLAACREPDPAKRWPLIEQRLDIDAMLKFIAFELMTCHWDGYSPNRNNYRVYFSPTNGKAYFLPHGMDQMFGDPGFSVLNHPPTIAAGTVMQNPDWRARYRDHLKAMLPIMSPPTKLIATIDDAAKRLRPVLAKMGQDRVRAFNDRANGLKAQLRERAKNLAQQLKTADPGPVKFDAQGRFAIVDGWEPQSESDDAEHGELDLGQDRKAFTIQCGASGQCVASWRCHVLLGRGKYRLEAKLKSENIESVANDRGRGGGIRISGLQRKNEIVGTKDWTDLTYEFEVLEDLKNVQMVVELRATKGKLLIDAGSLRVVKLPAK